MDYLIRRKAVSQIFVINVYFLIIEVANGADNAEKMKNKLIDKKEPIWSNNNNREWLKLRSKSSKELSQKWKK